MIQFDKYFFKELEPSTITFPTQHVCFPVVFAKKNRGEKPTELNGKMAEKFWRQGM